MGKLHKIIETQTSKQVSTNGSIERVIKNSAQMLGKRSDLVDDTVSEKEEEDIQDERQDPRKKLKLSNGESLDSSINARIVSENATNRSSYDKPDDRSQNASSKNKRGEMEEEDVRPPYNFATDKTLTEKQVKEGRFASPHAELLKLFEQSSGNDQEENDKRDTIKKEIERLTQIIEQKKLDNHNNDAKSKEMDVFLFIRLSKYNDIRVKNNLPLITRKELDNQKKECGEELKKLLEAIKKEKSKLKSLTEELHSKEKELSFLDEQPSPFGNKYRYDSNTTKDGYASGYHEVIPTDTMGEFYKLLGKSKDGDDVIIPKETLAKVDVRVDGEVSVTKKQLEELLKLIDGFRTDTAQTIMSASKGKVAGHSGSDLNQTNQADAHDLLRTQIYKMLSDVDKEEGRTLESMAVITGSMAITSMAPGDIAKTIKEGVEELKAKEKVLNNWEGIRNEAKRRLQEAYLSLDEKEKSFVDRNAAEFMESTLPKKSKNARRVGINRASSPIRLPIAKGKFKIQEGDYDVNDKSKSLKSLPGSPNLWGLYITEPFRAPRRE